METFLLMQCIIMEKHSNQINTLWWNKEKGSWLTDSQLDITNESQEVTLFQQVTTRHKQTDVHEPITKQDKAR